MNNFITFEGCEGVGKSTQLCFLTEYLDNSGQEFVATREPGGSTIGDKIREVILSKDNGKMSDICEAHLFAAARAEHIDKVLLPRLSEGRLVICDRYIDSSLAYQGVARNLGVDTVLEINRYAVEKCMPKYTVFIDLAPHNSWRRQKGKTVDDRMENESEDFHQKVYEGFKKLEKMYPERFISIVPSKDKHETSRMIIAALQERGVIR